MRLRPTLARLVALAIVAALTGCGVQIGPKFTATAFMGTYEHGATADEVLCSPHGERLVAPVDPDDPNATKPERAICVRTTWRTFNRRPWGTSENTATVTSASETIGQTGKGISDNLSRVAGDDLGGKAVKAFTPGGAAVAIAESIEIGGAGEDTAGADVVARPPDIDLDAGGD